MRKRAVVSVGVNPKRNFVPYAERLRTSVARWAPDVDVVLWINDWPKGSPSHEQVQYAFKLYAMKEAFAMGYDDLLWLNISCYAVAPLEPVFERIEQDGYYLMDSMDKMGEWSSDRFLSEWHLSRDVAMGMTIACGAILGLTILDPRATLFLEMWKKYATAEHFNGTHKSTSGLYDPPMKAIDVSSDPRCKGHRCDEPYWTMMARECGMKMAPVWDFLDNSGNPKGCLRSGYDLELGQ